ncbi:tRNA-specific adenosine deaminase subunit Tad3p [Monosporozyma unispora]|nr:tRNA-specific adenosine deaminase subunit tad3 [Kazachstania unispora]
MVKKECNPLHIDYKKCIIEDKLLQVKHSLNNNVPDLTTVWTIEIDPRDSKKVIDFIRSTQDKDPISLQHIKRIKKTEDLKRLKVVIISTTYIGKEADVIDLLNATNIKYELLSNETQIPLIGPSTKELVNQWSKDYWPLTWNGNPNDQILNDYVFDMEFIKKILTTISNISEKELTKGNKYPIVSAFVDPLNKDLITIAVDERNIKDGCSLDHSIICGIKSIAKLQREMLTNDKMNMTSYLCLNYDIYTTHEPCSMCSMALVHSRIKRCIFVRPMQMTGALLPDSGDGYSMHNNKILNSQYEVFEWLGNEFDNIPILCNNICC